MKYIWAAMGLPMFGREPERYGVHPPPEPTPDPPWRLPRGLSVSEWGYRVEDKLHELELKVEQLLSERADDRNTKA